MRKLAIVALTVGVLAVGCSSTRSFKFKFEPQRVTIVTEPGGAEVWQTMPLAQPSVRLGVTPLNDVSVMVIKDVEMQSMSLPEVQDLMRYVGNIGVEIRKEGFKPYVGLLAVKPGEKNEHRIVLEPLATK